MYSTEDINSLFDFLQQTPEKGLRQMLLGGTFTDAHLRLLLKMAKGVSQAEFVEQFNAENFGKLRLGSKEIPLKEKFWAECKAKFKTLGLIKEQKAA